jgi:5-methylcytosine-specific restriction protein A
MALDGAPIEPKHFSGDETSLCFALLRDAGYQIIAKGSDAPSLDTASMPEQGWIEGDRKLISHLKRERAAGLAKAKKAQFKRLHGKLTCERCKLDPVAEFRTEHAEACIEVHHSTTRVSQMSAQHRTTLDDVQCLCANCHRLVHRLLREETGG